MASDDLVVRTFAVGDREPVAVLILAGMAERWGSVDESLNLDLRDIARSYAQGATLVAELSGKVVGTGTVVPRADGATEIVRMAVDPTCRRLGIARTLVEQLVAVAVEWGSTRVVLETSADWVDAVAFYLDCGFVATH